MANTNSAPFTTVTTTNTASNYMYSSIGGALRRMSFDLVGQLVGWIQGGTAPTTRRMQDKVREMQISVLDYGATRFTSVPSSTATASDTAFTNAMAYISSTSLNPLTNELHIPAGYYRLANQLNVPIASNGTTVNFVGEGVNDTHIYMNPTSTTILACVVLAPGNTSKSPVVGMKDIDWHYYGTQTRTTLHGLLITHKVDMRRCRWDNFPGDGGKFESSVNGDHDFCVFFAKFTDCWFTNNGRYGMNLRYGANANVFYNCIFDNNGDSGLVQQTDTANEPPRDDGLPVESGSIYGCAFFGGQANNNGGYGYEFINGTNVQLYGCMSSGNAAVDDVYVGDNCLRTWMCFGYLTSTARVRVPAFNSNVIQIWYGGLRIFGNT